MMMKMMLLFWSRELLFLSSNALPPSHSLSGDPAGLTSLLLSIPFACASYPSSPKTSIKGAYSGRVIMMSIITTGTARRQKRAFLVPCVCPLISALMSNRALLLVGELGRDT